MNLPSSQTNLSQTNTIKKIANERSPLFLFLLLGNKNKLAGSTLSNSEIALLTKLPSLR